MGTSTKTNGNAEQLVKEALEHAERKKTKGNSLFKEGKHNRAVEEYHNSLNELHKLRLSDSASPQPEVVALTVTLHSNLTACHLAKRQYEQAVAEAQAALALDPLHTKAHFRLCKAMYELGRFDKAVTAMAVTVALTLPDGLDSAMLDLYAKVVAALEQAGQNLKLPFDMIELQSIVCVASNAELHCALLQGKSYLVFKPGSYTMGPLTIEGSLSLIGVGKVELRSGQAGHAIHLKSGSVYACNLDLVGNAKKSVVCVNGANADLSLVECVVQDHKSVGVLVVKGEAMLDRCSFTNIEKQALEVRPLASLQLRKCFISKCHQGVLMHGGARKLNIFGCEIKDTAREGIVVCGERQPREWGPRTPTLQILSTVVTGCGYYGLSLDMGIFPVISNSVLVNNSPFAISVQGSTTCIIAGCHIETGNRSGGLCVTGNGNAAVHAKECTFVVPVWTKFAIVQEGSTILPMSARTNKSKPVICENNQIFVGTLPKALTLEELEMREGPGIGTLMHSRDAGPQRKNHLTLVRTSRHLGHNLQKAEPFYPVGNTFGYDLSLGQDLSANEREPIRILLGACGDIRNLVKTVSALDSRLHSHGMVQVVLNDNNVVILARDVLLLSLIAQRTAAEDVVAIWANHALTSFQHKLLNDALATLSITLPEWLVLSEDCNLAAELLGVFASWRDCTMTLQGLLDERKDCNLAAEVGAFASLRDCSMTLQGLLDMCKQTSPPYACFSEGQKKYVRETDGAPVSDKALKLVRGALGGGREMHCFDEEIEQHIRSGNVGHVTKKMRSTNPTLLDAPSLQYYVQCFTSIYRAISINAASRANRGCALYEILLNTVKPQLKAVADVFERGLLRVAVDGSDIVEGMLCGGFLQLLRQLDGQASPSASPIVFDFIDLSNVSDYVSIPAVVQAALPLLKIARHATIHAQSMLWCCVFPRAQPSPFLRCATGMDLEIYQQLLGVKVQTQMVGVTHAPPLLMQWTWDFGTEEPWLTGAMVLLEVMAAAKFYCGMDRAHYVSEVCKGARMSMSGHVWAGIENASPLTLLHLLHLISPNIVMPIVHILVTTNDEYRKREWELMQHAMFELDIVDPNFNGRQFVKLVFRADADFFATDLMPLCVAVSRVALRRGEDVANTDVLQVFEAISYFTESDLVELMLQRALAENPKYSSYFMTLCVAPNCTNLQAVGTSFPWSKLSIEPLTAGLPRWTAFEFEGLGKRSLLSDDLELLMLIVKQINNTSSQSWKTHALFETARFVVVEILLPRPFPSADEVAVAITSSGASMTVTTRALRKHKGQKGFRFPETHVIILPTTVRSDGHRVKMSRKLALMTVCIAKTRET